LDGGRPFFFFSSAFFFLLLCSLLFLFSSSVSHSAVTRCAVMALKAVLMVVADRRMAWTVVGLSSSSSLRFFLLLCSPLFLFSSFVSHGAVVVCVAVEVVGRWSCCGRRRWLFSSLCRGVSLFFSSAPSLPLYLVFFSSLRSPSTVFLFHRVLLPLLILSSSPFSPTVFFFCCLLHLFPPLFQSSYPAFIGRDSLVLVTAGL